MRPDHLHVAVRPRGILECLDLAVLFCGRRPLGVAAAAIAGALPCILLNRLAFADATDDALLPMLLVHGLEAPWAAAPLVLFLGQAVFASRFSWRLAARSLVGALPALIVFQVLLRGACLGLVVLVPLVALGMYFLDPIILLERPRLARVWSRRTAMNRRNLAHVVSLAAIDGVVLAAGVWLGVSFLAELAAFWNGSRPPPIDETSGPVGMLASWPGQIALWTTNAFLVVYRFFGYLDARIRREGWDVELAFRSEATYAGLGGRAPAGGRGAVVGLALWGVVLAAAGAAPAAADVAPPSARRALERQDFPWYDAATDDYRPLVDARRPPPERPVAPRTGGAGPGGGPPIIGIDRVLQLALLLAAVAAGAWLLARHGWPDLALPADESPRAVATVLGAEQLEALPEAARRHGGDLLAEASARADRGDYAGATVFFHAWLLTQLHARGAIELARGKTNGRYVAEVAEAAPPVTPTFARSTRLFEDAFFGALPVAEADFRAVWERRGGLADLDPAGGAVP